MEDLEEKSLYKIHNIKNKLDIALFVLPADL